MNELNQILGTLGTLLLALGAFGKYMMARTDKITEEAKRENIEHNRFKFEQLERKVLELTQRLDFSEKDKRLFMRRIYQLEAFIVTMAFSLLGFHIQK